MSKCGCQVALQQWLDRNFASVTAMYEDRHELWGFDHQGRLFRRMLPARRAQVSQHILVSMCACMQYIDA